jgi:hypothetical protein
MNIGGLILKKTNKRVILSHSSKYQATNEDKYGGLIKIQMDHKREIGNYL